MKMKWSVIVRFTIVGLLWLMVCVWYVGRMLATDAELTLLSLFPIIASGIIVFVPLYKKYVGHDRKK